MPIKGRRFAGDP